MINEFKEIIEMIDDWHNSLVEFFDQIFSFDFETEEDDF